MLTVQQTIHQRYQLQYKLGERPARQTWLARDIQTDSLVVIKLLASSNQMQWNDLKLFEREARILKQLDHCSIPQYRDYFPVDEDTHWFAIIKDYIPGESLQTLLDRGKHFSESEVKKIAEELLDILSYLHQLNPPVLHRDIKPSNIILGEDERIYLVDFGSIQDKAAAKGASFTVVGTYGYTPMEQFGGKAVAASDLYALGATLIHLLTRTPPAELLQEDSQIQFEDKIRVTQHLADWLRKMTQPTLKERFRSVSEARQALETSSVEDNLTQQPEFESVARPDNYLPEVKLQPAELEQQAQVWQESGEKKDYLLLKTQLSEARIIQQQQPLSPLAQNFIAKSIEYREGEAKRKRIKFWGLSLAILAATAIGGIIINERLKLRELNAAIEEVKNCGELLEKQRYLGRRKLANCETEIAVIENWANNRSLSNYDLQGAYLVGAELENADFRESNFNLAFLENANFQGANLENTNFQNAKLENANLQNADIENANLEGAILNDADLKDVDLSNANLRDSYMWNTDFEDANLEGANLKYISINSANFEGANLSNAKLLGSLTKSNFKDANIKNALIAVPRIYRLPISRIKSACNWEKAKYTANKDKTNDTWIVDEAANQQYIEQLKRHKISDPETLIDCSQWE